MKNILVAETANKRLFYLTESYDREELMAIRNTEKFFCPTCRTSLVLKIGNIKTPHFAHKTLSDCDSFSEPESPLHLQGKLLLHQFFKDKNFSVELEKYLPEIRQRADLLINKKIALEFQCSAISASEISRRSIAYEQLGIRSIWIDGTKEKRGEQIQIIRIKAYQQTMLQDNLHQKYLLSLDPEEQRFYYYSNLFFVSGNRWIGKVKGLSRQSQSFPFAVPRRLTKAEFRSVCILFEQTKKGFIKSQFYVKNKFQNPFWLICYKLGLDMKNLSESIGVPFYGADCIRENPVLWQLKAIYANHQGVSMSELVQSGKLEMADDDCHEKAALLLEKYLQFHQTFESLLPDGPGQLDALYDIYCKTL